MIKPFGTVIRSYKGKGRIIVEQAYSIIFELFQVADGNIYINCEPDRIVPVFDFQTVVKIVGETDDGKVIVAEGNIYNIEIISMRIQILIKKVQIGELSKEIENASVVFKITNLKINKDYKFNIDGYSISIIRESNYNDTIKSLSVSRSVEVTCSVVFKEISINDIDNIIKVMDNLCILLTLAKGCNINWIFYDVSKSDSYFFSRHENRITKQYGILRLIATEPTEDLVNYINETYKSFLKLYDILELDRTITEYTDAKIETDYLEFRALKQVVTLEQIKSDFLSKVVNREFIVSNEIFKNNIDTLKKIVKEKLNEIFDNDDTSSFELMTNHLDGLNYYPLRRAIHEMCKYYNIKISKKEIHRFINIRNSLVHRVKFDDKYGEPWYQYCFLMTFVGKILLSILGYTGYFLDWTNPATYEYEARIKISD